MDSDDLDEPFRTFQDDSETDENRGVPVPVPRQPEPNSGHSTVELPEPDAPDWFAIVDDYFEENPRRLWTGLIASAVSGNDL